jgi:hypothetical protein
MIPFVQGIIIIVEGRSPKKQVRKTSLPACLSDSSFLRASGSPTIWEFSISSLPLALSRTLAISFPPFLYFPTLLPDFGSLTTSYSICKQMVFKAVLTKLDSLSSYPSFSPCLLDLP